ncbi:MAG: DUF2236 domain-containing protein [Bacteroidota bacterium]|nr:DUF2236 domain-containing protein [Bacteroidota bacterium]
MEDYFVNKDSIVRTIWGKADTVLFIFAGAAAEFALNKAVDWLYFTGKLPADPLGRLFSTVAYASRIIFSETEPALKAIDQITGIHKGVENKRGAQIPDWAYLDVLFLLIDYSIRSFESLERRLSEVEKEEVFNVFNRVGSRMQLTGLPQSYMQYCAMRQDYLRKNLLNSDFTADLYTQYKKHLGVLRYAILKQVQLILVPSEVKEKLLSQQIAWIKPLLLSYKLLRIVKLEGGLKNALLPGAYRERIQSLNYAV